MAREQGKTGSRTAAPRRGARSGAVAPTKAQPVTAAAPSAPSAPKPRTNPAQFANEVRQEARKITWPSWKETWITSVMVFIMVTVTALFFLVADGSLSFLMQQVLKLAG